MQNDLISVIIPVYNAENTLERCVNSVIDQTYSNLEIILVNDGSKDKSLSICKELKLKDKRIKLINSENKGVSSARNIGIDNSLGKYIMFVDSDDYVDNQWCETLYSKVKENTFCISNIYCVDDLTSKMYAENNIESNLLSFDISEFYEVYKLKLLNQPYNKIYEKKILTTFNIKFDKSLSLGEDLLFNLDYLLKCHTIQIINKRTYYYIKGRQDSLCNKFYSNLYSIQKRIYLKMLDTISSIDNCNLKYKKECYTEFLFILIVSIKNVFLNNNDSLKNKLKKCKEIVKSNEFDNCLKNANKEQFGNLYWNILSSKNFILILSYYKLCEFKSNLKINRRNNNEN